MKYIAALALALVALGCGPGADRVVGKWEGGLKLSQEDIQRAPATSMDEQQKIIRDAEATKLSLDVRDDGTYTYVGFDGFPVTDSWVIQGKYLVITSSGSNPSLDEKEKGKRYPNQIPAKFKIAEDGTLVYEDPTGEMSSVIILSRQ